MQRMYDMRVEHFQMLLDAGILLLQGTDAGGYQEHGSIAGELGLWSRWGASSQAVIDVSTWVSLRYLGRPGLVEGADADLLILDDDPRADPLALARPTSVYIGGECAWQRP
jgi:amidohydrolase family protein